MKNSEQPAFPVPDGTAEQNGLTKREYFAGLAMQGFLRGQTKHLNLFQRMRLFIFGDFDKIKVSFGDRTEVAMRSIEQADELLKQLEK